VLALARETVLPRRIVQGWYLPHDVREYGADVFPVFERVGDVNAYGFPTIDGATVKIGVYTSGHPVVYDTENVPLTVGDGLLRRFRDTVGTYLPGLHPDPVATTVNLEGYTTDGRPLVGPAPDADRLRASSSPRPSATCSPTW
jgi:sarcosine oxidase